MPHYRLYVMGHGTHISRALDIECETDEEAIEAATRDHYTHAVEVWQGSRLVKRIEPQ